MKTGRRARSTNTSRILPKGQMEILMTDDTRGTLHQLLHVRPPQDVTIPNFEPELYPRCGSRELIPLALTFVSHTGVDRPASSTAVAGEGRDFVNDEQRRVSWLIVHCCRHPPLWPAACDTLSRRDSRQQATVVAHHLAVRCYSPPLYNGVTTWYEFLLKQFNPDNFDYGTWMEQRREASSMPACATPTSSTAQA